MSEDSQHYLDKKQFFQQLLTIYGRKPVLEALHNPQVSLYKVHLADSNRRDGIVDQIIAAAEAKGVEIAWHERRALSRISKNGKQDQGVAADLQLRAYRPCSDIDSGALQRQPQSYIALDGVSNPQNLGMIVRSVAASGIAGLIIPRKGCAALSPLVIKASVSRPTPSVSLPNTYTRLHVAGCSNSDCLACDDRQATSAPAVCRRRSSGSNCSQ